MIATLSSPGAAGFTSLPPLALYIHIPWCVRKCPYCDFNSHAAGPELPEDAYVTALLDDLDQEQAAVQDAPVPEQMPLSQMSSKVQATKSSHSVP